MAIHANSVRSHPRRTISRVIFRGQGYAHRQPRLRAQRCPLCTQRMCVPLPLQLRTVREQNDFNFNMTSERAVHGMQRVPAHNGQRPACECERKGHALQIRGRDARKDPRDDIGPRVKALHGQRAEVQVLQAGAAADAWVPQHDVWQRKESAVPSMSASVPSHSRPQRR